MANRTNSKDITVEEAAGREYDAVIVPGGGLDPETGEPRPWVAARLDAALTLDAVTKYFIVLSRGTTHRPPPSDSRGFPVDESSASAAYLLRNGVARPSRVLVDNWSVDTIGNAFYARQTLAEPLGLHKLIVVTSAFHMPRTRAIFEWVFGLEGSDKSAAFSVDYCASADVGLEPEDVAGRVAREMASLRTLEAKTVPRVSTIAHLTSFLHAEHGAYNAQGAMDALFPPAGREPAIDGPVVNSY
jgi:hypothetical protein